MCPITSFVGGILNACFVNGDGPRPEVEYMEAICDAEHFQLKSLFTANYSFVVVVIFMFCLFFFYPLKTTQEVRRALPLATEQSRSHLFGSI